MNKNNKLNDKNLEIPTLDGEIWKNVKDDRFENLYMVSNLGRVFKKSYKTPHTNTKMSPELREKIFYLLQCSDLTHKKIAEKCNCSIGQVDRASTHPNSENYGFQIWKGGIRKLSQDADGYLVIGLCKNGIKINQKVHQLVAKAFIPNPENKPEVNHKDFDRKNNNISNLIWATTRENMQHSWQNKPRKMAHGIQCWKAKLTEFDIPIIKELYFNYSINTVKIGKLFNVHGANIRCIIKGKSWKHVK